jgi:hypothetical protein
MSRRIITIQPQAAGTQDSVDHYSGRGVKYIPADIVAAWLTLVSLLAGESKSHIVLLWVIFGLLLTLTPVWVLRVTKTKGMSPAWTQSAMSTLAFAGWVFAVGQLFSRYSFYDTTYGGTALILFTLISGLVAPEPVDSRLVGSRVKR